MPSLKFLEASPSDTDFARLFRVLHSPDGFVKIHGLGNDFIVMDGRKHLFRPDPSHVAALCNRHAGIGGDQVLVLEAPISDDEDVRLRIYNIDGMEAQTCLNATRCIAWLMLNEGGVNKTRIGTIGGIIEGQFAGEGQVTLRVPPARLDWRAVPLAEKRDTLALGLTAGPLTAQAAVSMGNPHLVCLVPSLDDIDVPRWADALQKHPLLPEGANVGVGEIIDDTHMRLVVWERPGMLTNACGSGACAALVVARRLKLTSASRMEIAMPGGKLVAEEAPDGTLLLTGAVEVAFLGFVP
jgi:diaminopimelate epimerase